VKNYIRSFVKAWIDYVLTSPIALGLASLVLWRFSVNVTHVDKSIIFVDLKNISYIAKRFIEYFHIEKGRIEALKESLTADTDELSHAIVNRCCATYRHIADVFDSERERKKERKKERTGFYCIPSTIALSDIEVADAKKWEILEDTTKQIRCLKLPGYHIDLHKDYVRKRSLAYIDQQLWQLKGRDVLDGGANIGQSALIFSELGVRSIHSFEPARDSFATLLRTIRLNKKERVIVPVNMATSDKKGQLRLYTSGCNAYGASTIPLNTSFYDVQTITIDEYVDTNNLDVALIKLDVEGAEYATILGASETIKKYKPILLISIYHTPKDFFEIKPFVDRLGLGYNFMIRQTPYNSYWAGYELLCYVTQ
jgi:FkbM family methyltransferase